MKNSILNLHLNTNYSFLESAISLDNLFKKAVENKITTLAITDHNSMFALPMFLEECRRYQIKPIIGIDLDVEDFRLILLAKNYQGYQELNRLSDLAYSKIPINRQDIDYTNLVVIDHPVLGIYAKKQEKLLINNFYFNSLDPLEEQGIFVQENKTLETTDNEVLSILHKIKTGVDQEFNNTPFALKWPDIDPVIIQRTIDIVQDIDVQFPTSLSPLPKFPQTEEESSSKFLLKIIKEAIVEKEDELKKYSEALNRVKYELKIIDELGFSDYFLIIWDIIRWAKNEDILVGLGRGSVGSSLIAYLLNITEINPLKYDLYFERFLNKKRVTMPDIDIDIQDTERDRVVDYVFEKYGQNNVAMISNFLTIAARTALRDSARVLSIAVTEVDKIAKLVLPNENLNDAFKRSKLFRLAIEKSNEKIQMFEYAKKIEGFPRQHGTHAAGIVIAQEAINTIAPTFVEENKKHIQFSMNYLEEYGLLKVDLLGLRNLSILKDNLQLINQRNGSWLKIQDLPLNDYKTNQLLTSGKTIGIFQLESPGMKKTLTSVKVNNLEDLAAIISLWRPGPMKNIDVYINRKFNKEPVEKIHPKYDAVVASTFGIIIYQEQIMKIAQDVGNIDFAEADILRKAISKKDFSQVEPIKQLFFKGALENNLTLEQTQDIFANIEKFAEYGFNKAHAISYAALAYKMAYLKVHYPIEFYTSLINNAHGSHDLINKILDEAKSMQIQIISPTVNESTSIPLIKNNSILLPLIMIKGFGEAAINQMISEREQNGKFTSFFDFYIRMRNNGFGDSKILLLINANVLREFGNMKTLENAIVDATIIFKSKALLTQEEIDERANLIEKLPLEKQYEIDHEQNLLGSVYNYANNINFEGDIKLADIHDGTEHRISVQFLKYEEKISKNGAVQTKIYVRDSSKSATIFCWLQNFDQFKNTKKNTIITIDIRYKNNFYNLASPWWKEENTNEK